MFISMQTDILHVLVLPLPTHQECHRIRFFNTYSVWSQTELWLETNIQPSFFPDQIFLGWTAKKCVLLDDSKQLPPFILEKHCAAHAQVRICNTSHEHLERE